MSATIQESPSGSGQRVKMLNGLTGFRFPIALFIFLVHSTHLYNPAANYMLPVTPFANEGFANKLSEFLIGVGLPMLSLFFMLSGFVLTWSSKPGEKARFFWRRRFFRVIPNHVVTFVLACILVVGATTNWLPNLLLVHTWDLCRAIGADEHLNEDLVAAVWAQLEPVAEALAQSGVFGQGSSGAVESTEPTQRRLLDICGRRP